MAKYLSLLLLNCLLISAIGLGIWHWDSVRLLLPAGRESIYLYPRYRAGGFSPHLSVIDPTAYARVRVTVKPATLALNQVGEVRASYNPQGAWQETKRGRLRKSEREKLDGPIEICISAIGFEIQPDQCQRMAADPEQCAEVAWQIMPTTLNACRITANVTATILKDGQQKKSFHTEYMEVRTTLSFRTALRSWVTNTYNWIATVSISSIITGILFLIRKRRRTAGPAV